MGAAVELINGWIWPLAAAPFIGSFLGVLVRRLPAGRDVVASRSACEACGVALPPWTMVPLLSFAALRGRCHACRAPISRLHPAIELASLAVAASAAWRVPGGPFLWTGCVLGWTLLALGWIDAQTFLLPDVLTLPLILAGLAQSWALTPDLLLDHSLAAAGAYTMLYLLAWAYRRLRGREGLGLGDAKLLAAGGAWLGIVALPWVAVAGSVFALLWALCMRARGTPLSGGLKLPFGPFIAAAIWCAWLIGP